MIDENFFAKRQDKF